VALFVAEDLQESLVNVVGVSSTLEVGSRGECITVECILEVLQGQGVVEDDSVNVLLSLGSSLGGGSGGHGGSGQCCDECSLHCELVE